ncbi:hypothetical protein FRB90_003913 [Tulasnella sp. 427]|nr:hypothetical protein FRB90_003913 [Tulasnella sp. 427]
MIVSVPLLLLTALAGNALAHPGHSDELDEQATRDLFRRHEIVARRCSSSLKARRAPAMERIHARRAAILAGEVAPNMLLRRATTATSSNPSPTGSMSMPNGGMPTGSMGGGNMSGGPGGQDQGTTSYSATATAVDSVLSVFPSATQSAQSASATGQTEDSACVLSPETVVGPYYIKGEDIRSNLIDDEKGLPFYAEFALYNIDDCEPLSNAAIDIWSCNATGEYSGFVSTDATTGYDTSVYNGELAHLGDENETGSTITDAKTALRGQQLTDENGIAQFTTLLPGWYSGRTVHIHVRVHVGGEVTANGTYVGGNITHTGQTFFGEDLYEMMQSMWPYTENSVVRLANSADSIYTGSNGTQSHWNLYYVVPGDLSQGVIGHINLIVDPSATNLGSQDMMASPGSMNVTSTNSTSSSSSSPASATSSTNAGYSWSANSPILYFVLLAMSHVSFKLLKSYA